MRRPPTPARQPWRQDLRILFASDFHALRPAFELFAEALAVGQYDLGVLGGDLLDDFWLPEARPSQAGGPPLFPPREGPPLPLENAPPSLDSSGLLAMELEYKKLLAAVGKPVLLISGNHDLTPWEDYESVLNIHGKRVEFGEWSFVGYRFTAVEKSEEERGKDLEGLRGLVDRKTVLLTHEPPFGKLDSSEYEAVHWGGKALARFVRKQRPAFHLFGHIHGAYGIRLHAVNGSYPNSRCFYDIDLETGKARAIPAEGGDYAADADKAEVAGAAWD
jgi:Icc-related predicted phosphoesterase